MTGESQITRSDRSRILWAYKALLRSLPANCTRSDQLLIRKAFDVAAEAHRYTRRKSGEPYILHPLAVSRIVTEEIGLGTTAVVCALLHDVVEDTDILLEDIENMFGSQVAMIIDGLTKIENVVGASRNMQAENFRKMLLTISDDLRVILIKLADRLHNMRTLNHMRQDKQQRIASETFFLYAPLAHRIGLYNIMTEMQDLSFRYTDPKIYTEIENKLKKTAAVRARFINRFILPVKRAMEENGLKFSIKGRPKSVYSIFNKMRKKGVPFEEVYDVFAIRMILDSDEETEKADCWKAYSIITDFYVPNPDRLRDWISTPKGNGYESLHTTVMSPTGKWVEVQIRSKRMDEIAEKGLAAHWKYKEGSHDNALDNWISKIRDVIDSQSADLSDFVNDFRLNLFSEDIFVFTPKGDLKKLPAGATALDFAFDIHTQIGVHCMGAKVNHVLVPLSNKLKSGDQVEIITSAKQKPKDAWLNYVVTGRAKSKIRSALKEDIRKHAEEGRSILRRKIRQNGLVFNEANLQKLVLYYKMPNLQEMYCQIADNKLDLKPLRTLTREKGTLKYTNRRRKKKNRPSLDEIVTNVRGKADTLYIGDDMRELDYTLAACCNPIPGDDVFGFITVSEGIKIHRVNCPNAIQLMGNYAYRILKARWNNEERISFLAGIAIKGIDEIGVVNHITRIISGNLNVNMRSLSFDTEDGMFEGKVMLYVNDTKHLKSLFGKLKKIKGVTSVERIDSNDDHSR